MLGWQAAARADGFVTFVDDPEILAALEGKGFGFAGIFGVEGKDDLATLDTKSPAYKKIVETVGADVAALRAEMKAGGRPLYEVTDGNVGRVIDMRWLTTRGRALPAGRRRQPARPSRLRRGRGDSGCGEVRFIYRLAYAFKKKGKLLASRLPVNFNAVFSVGPTPTAAAPASPAAGRRSSTKRSTPAG